MPNEHREVRLPQHGGNSLKGDRVGLDGGGCLTINGYDGITTLTEHQAREIATMLLDWADEPRATAMPSQRPPLRVRGVGRMADNPQAVLLILNAVPSDDNLRELHDFLRHWRGE